jgi:16S rRNA (adenine1518-N6/adenine1519-N6)-dimethyltransferase
LQTLTQIRKSLDDFGLSPSKRFGQNFLIDHNLLRALIELAALPQNPQSRVLEIGPGTGSLTEELLDRCSKVVAAEIDHGFCRLLRSRFADRPNFVLVEGDVLQGKHGMNPDAVAQLDGAASLVSNLPYNIATPVVAQCLISSWYATFGNAGVADRVADVPSARPAGVSPASTCDPGAPLGDHVAANAAATAPCYFDSMTFTIQREVAQRMNAATDSGSYGPVSVLVALLGRVTEGPLVPATAFWPRPNVVSRMLRVEFDKDAAHQVADVGMLRKVLAATFNHRRKQVATAMRHFYQKPSTASDTSVTDALALAGIKPTQRAETITPPQFLKLANALSHQGPSANANNGALAEDDIDFA